MADIRIRQLPDGGGPVATDYLPIDNGSTRKATIQNVVEIGRPAASQAEAEAGTNPSKVMTPLTTKQAVDFYGLTKAGNLAGLADLPTARSNLGVAIGSNVQAYDAALESISGLTTSADQMLYTTGSDAYATTALTPFARTILDDANAAAAQSTLGLVIGTNVQAFDADLAAIAALTSAADKLPYATGAGTWAMADFTAAGRALVDDATAADQVATLGLDTGLIPLALLGSPTGDDWTAVINNALAAGKKILLPEGTTNVTGIIVVDRSVIVGAHRQKSILKLKNGSNTHVIATEDFDTQFGTVVTDEVPDGIVLQNFTIDGNRANNTAGNGIALYARRMQIRDIDLVSIEDHGISCDYNDAASGPATEGGSGVLGMEGEFSNISMDYIGGHGMWMRGPHDSSLDNIYVIHASQKTSNTYDAFRFESTFTCRGRNLHCYNSGFFANHRYGIYDAAGCEISDSHFEGSGTANVILLIKGALYKGIRAYATRNAAWNVVFAANECTFQGFLGGKAALSEGVPTTVEPVGIVLGRDAADFCQANIIDVVTVDNNGGSVSFIHSDGQNKVTVRGEQASGGTVLGTPLVTDDHDIVISGARYGGATGIAAAGTGASDATQLVARSNRVTSASGNFGVKLPASANYVGGFVTVSNATASTIKVYFSGSDFFDYGTAFPAFISIASGKNATFACTVAGAWAPIIGA